jgi:fructose-1,6-bisphosphatase/inositol monophosphatase family enzyme
MDSGIRELLLYVGRMMRQRFDAGQNYSVKSRGEFVCDIDTDAEEKLIGGIKSLYPDDPIYSEEAGQTTGESKFRWLIDPLDGSACFIAGVPYFAISMAREKEREIVEGYVFNPISEELYYSSLESGRSFLNGREVKVSDTREIRDALVGFGFSARMDAIHRYYEEWREVFDLCRKGLPLIVPSLTLCNVARGRLDAFLDFGSSMEGHAAAAFILLNAGGTVWNYDLSQFDHRVKGVAACNAELRQALFRTR